MKAVNIRIIYIVLLYNINFLAAPVFAVRALVFSTKRLKKKAIIRVKIPKIKKATPLRNSFFEPYYFLFVLLCFGGLFFFLPGYPVTGYGNHIGNYGIYLGFEGFEYGRGNVGTIVYIVQ